MSESRVEKVARAICSADDSHDPALWREFIPEARAAIEAMRPTRTEDFTETEWRAINDWLDSSLS